MKKIRVLSVIILSFFLLSFYSHLVYNAALDGKESNFLAYHLTNFANYPTLISNSFKTATGAPPTFVLKDPNFKEVNKLDRDLFGINSFWDNKKNEWDIRLFNFKNDDNIHHWYLKETDLDLSTTNYTFSNAMPRNCIMLENRSLIVSADESANIMRLDSNSNILWKSNKLICHHSLTLDADSNLWACTSNPLENKKEVVQGMKNIDGRVYEYAEDYITKYDINTGEILYKKGVCEILRENNYRNFIFGFKDPFKDQNDPIHLNDIEPVLEDGPFWKKGDLFISLRHRSLVFLYRPSTNKILRLIFGEFITQHDVDILSDSTILIFSNNLIHHKDNNGKNTIIKEMDSLQSSELIIYNFTDTTFSKFLDPIMKQEKISTNSQGLQFLMSNNDIYVESQNDGKMYMFNENGIILKKMFQSPLKKYVHRPHWISIYEEINF